MKQFLTIFVITLVAMYLFIFFGGWKYGFIAAAFVLALIIHGFVCQSDKIEELEKRIRGRGTEPEEIVQQRLSKASREMELVDQYKFIVCNEDPKLAASIISLIIKRHME